MAIKPLVLDCETSISKTKIHGVSSKNLDTDIYTLITGTHPDEIKIEHKAEGYKRTIDDVLFSGGGTNIVVGHNLSFDLGYIWHTKAWQEYIRDEENTIWDTSEAEYILSGQRHKYASLAELQEKYLGKKTKEDKISKLFKHSIGADQIIAARLRCPRLFKLYNLYCREDGATTLRIFSAQYKEAKRLGMLKLIQARMKGLLAVFLMQNTGINIDVAGCENTLRDFKMKSLDYLSQAIELTKHLWDERLGAFNINSPKQKSAMLFGGDFIISERVEDGKYKNGNTKYKKVDKTIHIEGLGVPKEWAEESKIEGRWGTGKDVLNEIHKKCKDPLVIDYCDLQKKSMNYGKMCSTYLEPFLKFSIDGVLYPNYNTNATETSRLSSSSPNMQNVPASGEMLDAIQGQLIAPEGWVCVDIDYSSLEPWVTALITGDKNLARDLLGGICLHCRAVSWIPRLSEGKTYEEIYQLAVIEKEPKWVLARKKAKGVNFKRAYGGGAKSLAEAEGLDIEDVKAVFASQEEEYYGVKEFTDKLYAALKDNEKLSREKDFSKSGRVGRVFSGGIELLPIFDEKGNKTYQRGEFRHYGAYISPWGHRFTFEENGRLDKFGRLRRAYSTTETRNYQIQGSAGDIVEAAMAECMYYVLRNSKEVRMVRQIHDSIGFYVKKGTEHIHIPALCAILKDIRHLLHKYLGYEAAFNFQVEAKCGKNFAQTEVYDEQIQHN